MEFKELLRNQIQEIVDNNIANENIDKVVEHLIKKILMGKLSKLAKIENRK